MIRRRPLLGRRARRTGQSRTTDEGDLLERLPRTLSLLRRQPQQRRVPLREERQRSADGSAGPAQAGLVQKAITRYTITFHAGRSRYQPVARSRNAQPKAETLEAAHVHTARARSFDDSDAGRVPELPRKEAAPPGMPEVRILQGSRSD